MVILAAGLCMDGGVAQTGGGCFELSNEVTFKFWRALEQYSSLCSECDISFIIIKDIKTQICEHDPHLQIFFVFKHP